MGFTREKEWITEEGYKACVLRRNNSYNGHRCGYVGIPKDHKLYGVDYSECVEGLKNYLSEETEIGKRGILSLLCSENTHQIDMIINVHGSLTFAGLNDDGYPVEKDDFWWFGYDCAHAGDNLLNCSLQYCINECACLSTQLKKVDDFLKVNKEWV